MQRCLRWRAMHGLLRLIRSWPGHSGLRLSQRRMLEHAFLSGWDGWWARTCPRWLHVVQLVSVGWLLSLLELLGDAPCLLLESGLEIEG